MGWWYCTVVDVDRSREAEHCEDDTYAQSHRQEPARIDEGIKMRQERQKAWSTCQPLQLSGFFKVRNLNGRRHNVMLIALCFGRSISRGQFEVQHGQEDWHTQTMSTLAIYFDNRKASLCYEVWCMNSPTSNNLLHSFSPRPDEMRRKYNWQPKLLYYNYGKVSCKQLDKSCHKNFIQLSTRHWFFLARKGSKLCRYATNCLCCYLCHIGACCWGCRARGIVDVKYININALRQRPRMFVLVSSDHTNYVLATDELEYKSKGNDVCPRADLLHHLVKRQSGQSHQKWSHYLNSHSLNLSPRAVSSYLHTLTAYKLPTRRQRNAKMS